MDDSIAPPSIRLDQFLKTCGVETGGQAKLLIQSGEVLVNGEIEMRRRKRLHIGDEVTLGDDVFIVAGSSSDEDDATDASDAGDVGQAERRTNNDIDLP